ncbi:MAG: SRPBCC family protein [Gammaproteobacteria bacterium]|nr:SRPBCC family protein [Gammaproteobacteria bacterium]
MQVNLDKTFAIDASSGKAWLFLQDIPGVAGCMPGAEITDTIDDSHYKGKVKAKIGPATMAFNGDIEIKGIDADKRELHLLGQGQDTKGSSSATMDLTATVVDSADGKCELKGVATVSVTGKAASLGGRMMTQVADQILNQFGKNFANNVLAMGEGEAAAEAKEELAEQPAELNGLAFAWSVFIGFLRSLFRGKSANQSQ